jgi:hypothetical protein
MVLDDDPCTFEEGLESVLHGTSLSMNVSEAQAQPSTVPEAPGLCTLVCVCMACACVCLCARVCV